MLNKYADRISPCFKPFNVRNVTEKTPFHKTFSQRLEYKTNKIRKT